ncbi:uncharacterized protein LOC133525296 [Cydia pomonella]|uniref:uncharacterized protein LOC133525296 n=1 Tax=Cydia pomonella TaxID=82600 RepID=UPI002ADDABCE|nr:uncharacterized protein LOC133525296 [Cydia pomonella]
MTVLKWLEIFLKIEEFFGFSRTFVTWSIPGKLSVFLRVLVEFVLAIFVLQKKKTLNSIAEFILTNTLSFGSLLLSCYYSKTFLRFISNIQTNNIIFKSDSVYSNNLIISLKLEVYIWFGYFISICVIATININMFYHIEGTIMFFINKVLVNLRFHIELAVITCTLCTMSEQLQSITRSIKKEHAIDSPARKTLVKDDNDVEGLIKNVDQWLFNYSNVKKCSNIFNEIYGIQVLECSDNAEQKELLKLLRVVINQPIYIKTFGAVSVNMTLVPACFGLIVSYTVVALQFNNVV